jgi:hypothetical protein
MTHGRQQRHIQYYPTHFLTHIVSSSFRTLSRFFNENESLNQEMALKVSRQKADGSITLTTDI